MATRKTSTAPAAGERARAAEPPIRERVEAVRQRVAASIGPKDAKMSGSMIEHLPTPKDLASLVELREISLFDLNSVFEILSTINNIGVAFTCQPRLNNNAESIFNDVGELIDWHNEFIGFILDRCIVEARNRVPIDRDEACNRLLLLIKQDLDNAEYGSVAEAIHGVRMVAA